MHGPLQNNVAIVTGSASGINRAIALLYAAEGAVVVNDLKESSRLADAEGTDGRLTTVQEIQKSGGRAVFVRAKIVVSADVEALLEVIYEAQQEKILNVNLKGVF
ncbi:hypothetical protein PMIN06_012864 [Paraphaeosphaeria minitans]|uniref:Short-chain dehydrogenase reductase sdr n=1 Tax=Paraphaeosphaeria minitans TaxID=565426 RepID=A0A9P6GAU0_9PLEO|nr:short-chain dehydrogenase reductase sdr [Paraphaeosphaeria minitans]